MRYRPPELEKQFRAFKSGNFDALDAVLDSERERLFDFLMRMTGQVSKSADTASEAIQAVRPVAENEESLEEFLVLLYRTARNFTIEIWNADTSRLENAAYESKLQGKPRKDIPHLVALEHIIRSLPPKQREILILHERYGFSPDEIAEITNFGVPEVEEIFAQALGVTEAAMTDHSERVPELMTKLHPFPEPEDCSQQTQNLSLVFKNLKKSSRAPSGAWWKLLVGLSLIALIGLGIWRYDVVVNVVKLVLKQ